MDEHVVDSRGNGSCADCTSISGGQGDKDSVSVRVTSDHGGECETDPLVGVVGNVLERKEKREEVNAVDDTDNQSLVDFLRNPCPENELENEEEVRGNDKQVRLESVEANGSQGESKVTGHWCRWNEPDDANKVDWPHVVISERRPEVSSCKILTVVHVSLAGIIAQDTGDHNDFLPLGEPTVLSTEVTGGLCWRWWEVEVRNNTNQGGKTTLKGKEPSPSLPSIVSAKTKNSESKESRNDTGEVV